MSFWMNLAKVSPELLSAIRVRSDLLGSIFFDGGEPELPADFDKDSDTIGYQFFPGEESLDSDHWLSTVHRVGETLGYKFTYGEAFAVGPNEVASIAETLTADSPEGALFADAAKEGKAVVGGLG